MTRLALVVGAILLTPTWPSLETCNRECGLGERVRYCPVRDAPTQVFDGRDGVDVAFDLRYRSVNFTACGTNVSRLSWHWTASGQGYATRGRQIETLLEPQGGKVANVSSGRAVLTLADLNASRELFRYSGRSITMFEVYPFGLIRLVQEDDDLATTPVLTPTEAADYFGGPYNEYKRRDQRDYAFGHPQTHEKALERFLRTSYWPNLAVCALCATQQIPDLVETRIEYDILGGYNTSDERLVLTFSPVYRPFTGENSTTITTTSPQRRSREYQVAFYLESGTIELAWVNVTILGNSSTVVGLAHGVTPEWKALAYDALDLSAATGCTVNPNCTVETNTRPIGRTRPPKTRPYPYAIAPGSIPGTPPNPHPQFCQFGCASYYTNWTLLGCKAQCDSYYNYDVTCGYSDRAEIARYECYDGCAIANLRCQPGFSCFQDVMRPCPQGKYRDLDYYHVTSCDDCPHGRYRETTGARDVDSCAKCDIGRYLPFPGSQSRYDCTLCPPGRFANEPGMANCKCLTHYDGAFDRTNDNLVIYPACDPEDYLDHDLRPEIPSIDWSPRTTFP